MPFVNYTPEVFIDPIFDNSEHRLENFLAGQSDISFRGAMNCKIFLGLKPTSYMIAGSN